MILTGDHRLLKRIFQVLFTSAVLFWVFSFCSYPGFTQPTSISSHKTAPVVLDGRILFRLSNSGNFSAVKRAERVNQALSHQLKTNRSSKVTIVPINEYTTLRLNDDHLLTVTEADIMLGMGVEEQAQIWQQQMISALERGRTERTSTYLHQAGKLSLQALGIAIIVQLVFSIGDRILRRQLRKASLSRQYKSRRLFLWSLVLLVLQGGLWLALCYYICGLFPLLRSGRYVLIQTFTAPLITLGNQKCSIFDLVLLMVEIVGLWLMGRWFAHLFKSRVLQLTEVERGMQDTVGILVQFAVLSIGLLVIFQSWGIDVASLAFLVSALGVGVGFGLQNIANNFISGIILAFTRPIKVGDFIQLGDLLGTVEQIGSRSTEIITLDQVSIIIPNSRFLENEIVNWNHGNPVSRLKVSVGVAYNSNIQKVRQAILEAAKNHPEVLRHPPPQVWFQEFGDSSLNFDLFVWIRQPAKQFKYRQELNYRIYDSLKRYGIEIPFPQRDVNLRAPQLDRILGKWMGQNEFLSEEENDTSSLASPTDANIANEVIDSYESSFSDYSLGYEGIDIDIDTIISQMRGSGGVEIKTRRFGLKTYANTFVGSEAVEWFMQTQKAGIKAAIQLGQLLIDRGIIHHVVDEHEFKNEYLFYRFYIDE